MVLEERVRDGRVVSGLREVLERLLEKTAIAAPRAGPEPKLDCKRGIGARELQLQQLLEQMVVPEPLSAPVQRDEEQIGPCEVGEYRRAARSLEDTVAERARESGEDRRPKDEVTRHLVERVDDLARQVVGDVAVTAGEIAQRSARIRVVAQPERGKVEPRGPPFASLHEQLQVGLVEVDPLLDDEQLACFVEREREICGTELSSAPFARSRPSRMGDRSGSWRRSGFPPEDARPRARTSATSRRRARRGRRRARARAARGRQRCRQAARGQPPGRSIAVAQPPESRLAQPGADALERGRDVRPEPYRVVVGRVGETQATAVPGRESHHEPTRTLLPPPAGALTIVNSVPLSWSSACRRRGRATSCGRFRGGSASSRRAAAVCRVPPPPAASSPGEYAQPNVRPGFRSGNDRQSLSHVSGPGSRSTASSSMPSPAIRSRRSCSCPWSATSPARTVFPPHTRARRARTPCGSDRSARRGGRSGMASSHSWHELSPAGRCRNVRAGGSPG